MRAAIILLVCSPIILLFNNCSGKTASNSEPSSTGTSGANSARIGINTTGWSDSPSISRDGQRLYFMYSRYNFGTWIKNGMTGTPPLTGPDRPGLHKSSVNAFWESDIYVSTKNSDGTWGEPVAMGFNGAYNDSSGMEINNGNTFIWQRSSDGSSPNIVMANKNSDGTWGTPVDLGPLVNKHEQIGTDSNGQPILSIVDNPHLSADGKGLYFVSDRLGGSGGKDIWFSYNASGALNGTWSSPVNMSFINTSSDEDQPFVSSTTMDVYWNSSAGIMHCISNGSTCTAGTVAAVSIPGCGFAAEASLPDDGQTLYFGCVDSTSYQIQIMYAVKQANGSWGPATPVD